MTGIAVIVVNYGTADLAIEAVESVRAREHGGRAVEIHLVDNASPGDDAARLSQAAAEHGWGAGVTLHLEAENHGFGRGNNLVLERLAARETPPFAVFLLNPDARLGNEAIAILADVLEASPRVGFAGSAIALPDGTPVTAAFRFPGIVSTFSGALSFGPVDRLLARWRVPLPPDRPTGRVDWVAGAAVMARFEAIRAAGFFDPAYFLYYEEVDLMRTAARAGWETWYVAEARAVHAEGAATGVKSGTAARRRRPAYWYRSWRHYFAKNHGRVSALAAVAAWSAGAALNHALARLRSRSPAAPLHLLGDLWGFVWRPLLGLRERGHG